MDQPFLKQVFLSHKKLVVYETDLKSCGLAKDILGYANDLNIKVDLLSFGLDDHYVTQGSLKELLHHEHLRFEDILEEVKQFIHEKRTS